MTAVQLGIFTPGAARNLAEDLLQQINRCSSLEVAVWYDRDRGRFVLVTREEWEANFARSFDGKSK